MISSTLTTEKFPKTFKVIVFPIDADKRDLFLSTYAYETVVNNEKEECKFYESFDGDENIVIKKL